MLTGKRILVVEDDSHLADELCRALRAQGAIALGPAPTPYYAMHLLGRRGVDAAVLSDVVHGIPVFGLADELARRRVPVLFTSANGPETFPTRFQSAAHLAKPYQQPGIVEKLASLIDQSQQEPEIPRDFGPELARIDDGEITSRTRMLRAMCAAMRLAARRHADAREAVSNP